MKAFRFSRSKFSGFVAVAFLAAANASQAQPQAPADAFDGRWTTTLVCDDTHDKDKLVKGYTFIFAVVIEHGHLAGQYGHVDAPSSVAFSGQVAPDGSADITATGRTGATDYSMGQTPKGVAYGYRMRGNFDATSGRATRTSLRPCAASFARQ